MVDLLAWRVAGWRQTLKQTLLPTSSRYASTGVLVRRSAIDRESEASTLPALPVIIDFLFRALCPIRMKKYWEMSDVLKRTFT